MHVRCALLLAIWISSAQAETVDYNGYSCWVNDFGSPACDFAAVGDLIIVTQNMDWHDYLKINQRVGESGEEVEQLDYMSFYLTEPKKVVANSN